MFIVSLLTKYLISKYKKQIKSNIVSRVIWNTVSRENVLQCVKIMCLVPDILPSLLEKLTNF